MFASGSYLILINNNSSSNNDDIATTAKIIALLLSLSLSLDVVVVVVVVVVVAAAAAAAVVVVVVVVVLSSSCCSSSYNIIIELIGANRDVYNLLCAANCFQHERSSGQGSIVYQSTCNTSSAERVEHIVYHMVRRGSSAVKSDRLKSHLF